MGKKSRMKREEKQARAQEQAAMLMVAERPKTVAEQLLERQEAIAEEEKAARIERLNHLPIGHPDNIHKLALTFDPIDQWLDSQIETGLSDSLTDGTVIFKPREEEEWYPIAESFFAVCDTYELIAKERGIQDDGVGLRKLANKVHYGMPLEGVDIRAAKASIEWMKEVTKPMTPLQFSEFTVAIQVRATLALQKAA